MRSGGSSTNDWTPRPYREGDENEIARLASTVYPNINTDEYVSSWKAKYLCSPKGFASWLAESKDGIVGHYGALMARAQLRGRSALVAQAVDAFVHPNWRGRGIFVGLGKIILDDLGKKGAHLAYGIPNKAAMPGHRKLSWSIVVRVSKLVRIIDRERAIQAHRGGLKRFALRSAAAFASYSKSYVIPPGVSLVDSQTAWPKVEEVWRKSATGYDFALDRDKTYLAWRYSADSRRKYVVMLQESKGETVAASILRIGQDGVGQIAELFSATNHDDANLLLKGVVAYLTKNGCHTVEALASTHGMKRLMRAEGFMRTSNVLLIAHANDLRGEEQLSALNSASRIMLSFGDSDLV